VVVGFAARRFETGKLFDQPPGQLGQCGDSVDGELRAQRRAIGQCAGCNSGQCLAESGQLSAVDS
jgi:hypothetical protein